MRRNQGFTLLEVLLATTVLGVVMAMLSLALTATLRVIEATEQQEHIYYQAQTAMRRITEDLTAAIATPGVPFVGRKNALHDRRADSLTFASHAHLIFNPEKQRPGVARIQYRLQLDADDERQWKLLRSDSLVLPGGDPDREASPADSAEPAFLLAGSLRSVHFRYFSRDGQEFDSWQEEQESAEETRPENLPAAVHCTLEFWIDPDKESFLRFSTRVPVPVETKDGQ